MQNGFVKAYRSLHRFRVGRRLQALAAPDRRQRGAQRASERATAHVRLGTRAAEQHEAAIAGPDEAVIAREEVETVLGALARLPERGPAGARAAVLRRAAGRRGRRARGDVDGGVPRPPRARAADGFKALLEEARWLSTSSSCACAPPPVSSTREAPAFDVGLLRSVAARRIRGRVVVLACVVALVGVAAAPAAVSALQHLFDVDEVPELGGACAGRRAAVRGTKRAGRRRFRPRCPFRVRMISSLGAPDEARVRDDITGGMVTIVYGDGRILLTQWRTTDVQRPHRARPGQRRAEDVTVGDLPGLWIEGAARGTFTLTGADGAVHRESFEVGTGVLLWRDGAMTFLLQGAGSKAEAMRLAAEVDR